MERLVPLDCEFYLDSDDDESMVSSGDERDCGSLSGGGDVPGGYRGQGPSLDPFELEMDAEVAADLCQLKYCGKNGAADTTMNDKDNNSRSVRKEGRSVTFSSCVREYSDGQAGTAGLSTILESADSSSDDGDESAVICGSDHQSRKATMKYSSKRKRVSVLCRPSRIRHFRGNIAVAPKYRARRAVVSASSDLLYDPDLDASDQNWIDDQRRSYLPFDLSYSHDPGTRNRTGAGTVRVPPSSSSSDAVLNCPACMSMVCLDCQRHELYRSQYRAMFVFNCTVNRDRPLHYQPQQKEKRRVRTRQRRADPASPELYLPVHCSTCNTDIAVLDTNEVYHFFNVIASHA